MNPIISPADPADHETLTQLTLLSKAHWGYTPAQINSWLDILTITPQFIAKHQVFKMCTQENIMGYYAYILRDEQAIYLDAFFVLPSYIGQGIGKQLMLHFLGQAKSSARKIITLDADPNAEEFYKHFGFTVIGKNESNIKDRFLPVMQLELR